MIYTDRSLQKLKAAARTAHSSIRELVENKYLEHNDCVVWGQFLDANQIEAQFGLFGVGSALAILATHSSSPNQLLAAKAEACLEAYARDPSTSIYKASDLGLTLKVSFLCFGIRPFGELEMDDPAVAHLLGLSLATGWGYYKYAPVADPNPRALATAYALIAMARCPSFYADELCKRSLDWLARRVADGDLDICTTALCVTALAKYRPFVIHTDTYRRGIEEGTNCLVDWATSENSWPEGFDKVRDYWVNDPNDGGQNHYMILPVTIMVAYALLLLDNPVRARQYILDVVNTTAAQVRRDRGLVSRSRDRIATSDQLWAAWLFEAFLKVADNSTAVLTSAYITLFSKGRNRWIIGCLLSALIVLGAFGAFEDWAGWFRGLSIGLGALSAGVLAILLVAWSGGG